jgi:hypothetical protein
LTMVFLPATFSSVCIVPSIIFGAALTPRTVSLQHDLLHLR